MPRPDLTWCTLIVVAAATACDAGRPPACTCRPAHQPIEFTVTHTTGRGRIDTHGLYRRLRAAVDAGETHDRNLAAMVQHMCMPCDASVRSWSLADLYPLERLDDAVVAGCLFLELRDGTKAYSREFDRVIGKACR